jgi:hypothetical protein
MVGQAQTFLSREAIDLFISTEAAYSASRLGAVGDAPGNPAEVRIEIEDGLTTLFTRGLPWFNSIHGLKPSMASRVAELIEPYRSAQLPVSISIPPTDLTEELARALALAGLFQSGFHATLFAKLPMTLPDEYCGSIEIVDVNDPGLHEVFMDTYLSAWGMAEEFREGAKQNLRRWLGRPHWNLYLATVDGRPAAVAKSFTLRNVTYLADAATLVTARRSGCQTALLVKRIRDAGAAGSEWVFSKADFLSTSYRNMERIGMRLAYTPAGWSFLPNQRPD